MTLTPHKWGLSSDGRLELAAAATAAHAVLLHGLDQAAGIGA